MRRAQTSVEYLLLTAGVILVGVIASQAVVSSGTVTHEAIKEELNNIVPADAVPPSTDILCDGGACYSKYNRDINISFLCTDNLGGSGCAETKYIITQNGTAYAIGECNQMASKCKNVVTLKAPTSGSYTYRITFHSTDLNNNIESDKTVKIEIGEGGGLTSSCAFAWSRRWPRPGDSLSVTTYLTAGEHLYNTILNLGAPVNVSFDCGTLAHTAYMEKNCTISGIILPTTPNAYEVDVRASGTDDFGNSGTCGSDKIIVDGVAPNITNVQPDPCQWQRTDFTIQVTASDVLPSAGFGIFSFTAEDGIDPEYTSPDSNMTPWGGNPAAGTGTITVGAGKICEKEDVNACTINAIVSDRAGNAAKEEIKYSIDYTEPSVEVSPEKVEWQQSPINVNVSCNDNLSGCRRIYWKFVPAGNTCPPVGSAEYDVKDLCTPSGCPASCPTTAKTTITLDCNACKMDLCIYAEDVAGNTPQTPTKIAANDGAYQIDKKKSATIDVVNLSTGTKEWLNGGYISFKNNGEPVCSGNKPDPHEYSLCCPTPDHTFYSTGLPWTTQPSFYVPDLDTEKFEWPKPDSAKMYPYVFRIDISTPNNEAPIKYIAVKLGQAAYHRVTTGAGSEDGKFYPYLVDVDPDAVGNCNLVCWVGSEASSGFDEHLCPTDPRFEVDDGAVDEISQYDSGKGVFINLSSPSRHVQLLCAVDVPTGEACYADALYIGTEDAAGNDPFPKIHQEKIAIDNTRPGKISVNAQKVPKNPVCKGIKAPNGDSCENGWLRELDVTVNYSGFQQLDGAPKIGGGYVEILSTDEIGIAGGSNMYPRYSRSNLIGIAGKTEWNTVVALSESVGNGKLGPLRIRLNKDDPKISGETEIWIVPYTAAGRYANFVEKVSGYCYDEADPEIKNATYDRQSICSSSKNGSTPDSISVKVHAADEGTGIKSIKIVADDDLDITLAIKEYSDCGQKDVTATFTIAATKLLQLKYSSSDKITDDQIPIDGLKAIVCDQVGNCTEQYLWKEGDLFNHDLPDTIYILNAAKHAECWDRTSSYEQAICAAHEDKCATIPLDGWDELSNTSDPNEKFEDGYCNETAYDDESKIAYREYTLSCSSGKALIKGTAHILASDGKPRCDTSSSDTTVKTQDCSEDGKLCCAGKCYDPNNAKCCHASWDYERATWNDAKIANTGSGEFCCLNSDETTVNVCSSDECCDEGKCVTATEHCGTPTPDDCKKAGCTGGCTYTCSANSCTIVCK